MDWEDENMHILSREACINKDEEGGRVVTFHGSSTHGGSGGRCDSSL